MLLICLSQAITKRGIDFARFGLESGMVSRKLRECMNVFIISIPNDDKKEREIREFEVDSKKSFLGAF